MMNLQLPNVDGKEPNRRSVVVMDSENVTLESDRPILVTAGWVSFLVMVLAS